MSTLMQASTQWATRPAEERFASLLDMQAASIEHRRHSRAAVVSSRKVRALPTPDNRGLLIAGPSGAEYAPTNWSFGQLSSRVAMEESAGSLLDDLVPA